MALDKDLCSGGRSIGRSNHAYLTRPFQEQMARESPRGLTLRQVFEWFGQSSCRETRKHKVPPILDAGNLRWPRGSPRRGVRPAVARFIQEELCDVSCFNSQTKGSKTHQNPIAWRPPGIHEVPKEEVEDEMDILRKLDHPHIVRLFEWFETLG